MKKRTVYQSAIAIFTALCVPLAAQASNPRVIANNPKLAAYTGVAGAEKITGGLLFAATQSRKNKSALRDELATGRDFNVLNGETVIELQVTSDPALLKEISGTGAHIISNSPAYHRVTVGVSSADTVFKLAALPQVGLVMPVLKPKSNAGEVESGAVSALRIDTAAAKYSAPEAFGKVLDGTGQRVGILSDSFSPQRLALGQNSGDLPDDVIILSAGVGEDEGAGMGELVHDIAPGASMAFHTAFVSESDFADGIDQLVGVGCTVIADDVIYFAEPYYADGIVAQAAARAVASGVPFYSSAGNFANDALQENFVDVNPSQDEFAFPPTGVDLHKWNETGNGYLPITLPAATQIVAFIHWNQPQDADPESDDDGSQIDLDVFLTKTPNPAGLAEADTTPAFNQGRASVDVQGDTDLGFGNPFEVVSVINTSASPATYYLAINHLRGSQDNIPQAATPLQFTVVFLRAGVDADGITIAGINHTDSTGASTIWGHNVADGVMSCAAMNYYEPAVDLTADGQVANDGDFFGPTAELDPEPFSARGGITTIQFDDLGFYAPRSSFEPDITCVDGVNTTFFGSGDFDDDGNPNFFGTSAASPNAAAIVALMLELNPAMTPAQINAALTQTAIDVKGLRAKPGVDDVSGAGLTNPLAAITYVFKQFGIDSGVLSDKKEKFLFQSDSDGWHDESPPGFTPVGFSLGPEEINIGATDNVNTLGWLKSPTIAGSPFVQPPDPDLPFDPPPVTIDGTSGPNSLYRGTFRLSASTNTPLLTPAFRIRQSTESFEQSNTLAISSTGDASLSPWNGPEKIYKHYFSMPSGQSRFNLYFDVLGFDQTNLGGVNFAISEVDIEGLSTGNLSGSSLLKLIDFKTGSQGWTQKNIPEFGSVSGAATSSGLRLGPANDGNQISFSFWSAANESGEIVLAANRLYRATFRVKSSATPSAITAVPTFRLRANDSSNQFTIITDVNSTQANAMVPVGDGGINYYVYFTTPAEIVGNGVRFSFDYLFVPGIGDDPNITVTLQSLRIDSYTPPVGPQ